jgi:hypothetical protein
MRQPLAIVNSHRVKNNLYIGAYGRSASLVTKRGRNFVAILAMPCLVALSAISGRADDPSSLAPTEFESAPAVILHGSAEVLSVAVPQQGEHIFAALFDGSVMMLDRTLRAN